MEDFGQTFRKLRTSLSISQTDLAKGIFDRSRLSRIESGVSYPSQQVASMLISRLGVSATEFEYIQRNYSASKKEQILYHFFNISSNTEIEKINSLIKECSSIYNDDDIKRIRTVLQAQLLLSQQHNLSKAKKLVQPIWYNYLAKIKTLTIFDIALLNMIAYAFDNKTNIQIITTILNEIDNHYPFLKSLKCNTLINLANIHLDNHDIFLAKKTLTLAAKLAKENNQFEKLLLCKTELAFCDKNLQQTDYYINLLNEIGASDIATVLKQQIKQLSYLFN
ncbi:helix-turn-helix transcriptional regulator [Lactobacillus sp. ESL0684]|uniref:helix-turn-helix domain-containing protein n=1 Tax=Lactobacillus sp. ESL0684 TaxID=2983213 RepID=UPI0023F64EB6|nr:helix-turn-helix transcriptional regulator [Lactobacillus sp. ESL0684]WEV44164.1 helix-turn-helix transcriptional regulator [Lactobacillus sp. ESL0684]